MKAIIYRNINKIELTDIPEPEIKSNGAIIKIKGCGLCGSDIVKMRKGLFKNGDVPGHEVVGELDGQRVVLGHHVPCYNCVYCNHENYSMCEQFKKSNIIPGGFAEYIYVSEEHLKHTVFPVPENLPDEEASFTEPAACCLRAVKRSGIKQGDKALVIGLGSIGLIMGQILKHFGAEVYGSDIITERCNLAEELGIKTGVVNNADVIFLTAGADITVDIALSSVRNGGTIVVFASVPNDMKSFSNNQVYYKELTVLGSYSPSPADLSEALNLISQRIIKVDNLYTVYALQAINSAINDTVNNKIIKAYIKL